MEEILPRLYTPYAVRILPIPLFVSLYFVHLQTRTSVNFFPSIMANPCSSRRLSSSNSVRASDEEVLQCLSKNLAWFVSLKTSIQNSVLAPLYQYQELLFVLASEYKKEQQILVEANQFTDNLHFLLSSLVSNSNAIRASAEKALLWLSKNRPEFLCFKFSLLLCSPRDDMRFVAAVLLRQFFTPTSDFYLWPRLSPLCQFYLRTNLLLSLEEEQVRHVANAKGDTIAELASHVVPLYPQYPELLRFVLVSMAKTEQQILVEASLRIFSRITKPLVNELVPLVPNISSVLLTCVLHQTSSSGVHIAALLAFCSLLQYLPPKNRDELRRLHHSFGNVIYNMLCQKKPTVAQKALQLLIDFAGADVNFFRCFIQDSDIVMHILSIPNMLKVKHALGQSDLSDLVLEFAITVAETRKPSSGMVRRMVQCVPKLFSVLLEMLSDVGDNMPLLSAQPEGHELNQSDNYTIALEYLGRLVSALGGNDVLKAAQDKLRVYFNNSDWKMRHAAFISLARISEDCFENTKFEDVFNCTVLTAVDAAMDDFGNPCIQASAAKAFANFIEKINDDILMLMPYLDKIVEKLALLLKGGKQMVQEEAVSALTNMFVLDKFNKYYDAIMPQLLHTLMNATNKTNKMLLAKLADCITVFGLSSGKDKFVKHAHEVMGLLIPLLSSLDPDDPATNYVLRATNTICKYLSRDFLPYMDALMKLLLESVQLKADYGIASDYSISDAQYFDGLGTETPSVKGKSISLRSSFVERKALACNILLTYVEALEEHFLPWTEKVTLALAPLIRFKYHVEVKKASARAMPQLLNSVQMAIKRGMSQDNKLSVKQMFGFILPELLDGIHKEQDIETCGIIVESLSDCLQLSATHLKEYQVKNIVDEITYLITSSDARSRKREKNKAEHYYGEEALIDTENELEDIILEHIGVCLAIIIETHRAAFLDLFHDFSKHITPMLVSEESIQKRRISLLIFDEIAEKCGEAAVRYYDEYLPYLLVACNDADPIVRQRGLFGVGICAKFGRSKFEPFITEALARINNVIESPNALKSSHAVAYDNAVSSLGLICKFHKFRKRTKAIATWLNCLPIKHDLEEAWAVHDLLCSMVESSDRELLGDNNIHLTKIISIFAKIFCSGEKLVTEETHNRMVKILKRLKNAMPRSTFGGLLSSLSDEYKPKLLKILKW